MQGCAPRIMQHLLGSGWNVVASILGTFPKWIKQLPLDRHQQCEDGMLLLLIPIHFLWYPVACKRTIMLFVLIQDEKTALRGGEELVLREGHEAEQTMLNRVISEIDHRVLKIFFVHTTPFVEKYFTEPEDHTYDWSGIRPRKQYLSNPLQASDVDLYINGHDHCLEHVSSTDSGIEFLTSGGGSKAWRGDVEWWNPKEM
ncbi:hypothetical protein Patl1_14608 [Pistacia atlantica]|uniref:Uncharacterized protein n=1 Tax=Pistacia atlantica TaxID=434234 RepID=A0ACC1AY01_9ROSI|nr:hypothetical protein Patl1_14608 [Pistacia atlantica]